MFRGFHLAWSTWSATKTFVAGWRNAALWLVDLLEHGQICCATSCEFDEKQSQNLLLKVYPRSTFRSNFLQPAANVIVARQVDHGGEKREKSTKTCTRNETMLRHKLRVFVSRISQLIRRNMLRACCVMLWHDGCSWFKCENGQIFHGTFVNVAWFCSHLALSPLFLWLGQVRATDRQTPLFSYKAQGGPFRS